MTITTVQRDDGIKKTRGNYGVRVARLGYDASSCSDSQLLFNSAWPIVQITKVVDFSKNGKEYYTYTRSGETVDVEPEGLGTKTMEEATDGLFRVGKKYCYKLLEGGYAYDSDNNRWEISKFKVVSHKLGFAPLWFESDWVSGISNKIILTSIDIQTDIEYPYTDSPTAFLGSASDYGIKSSSIFGSKVDGLNTGMFSKLVQRVLTTQKSGNIAYEDGEIINKSLSWYPTDEPSELTEEEANKLMTQYECYCFDSTYTIDPNNLFISGYTKELSFEYRPVTTFLKTTGSGSSQRQFPIGFSTTGQSTDTDEKVMVIIRSPMVSPEYEEVEI